MSVCACPRVIQLQAPRLPRSPFKCARRGEGMKATPDSFNPKRAPSSPTVYLRLEPHGTVLPVVFTEKCGHQSKRGVRRSNPHFPDSGSVFLSKEPETQLERNAGGRPTEGSSAHGLPCSEPSGLTAHGAHDTGRRGRGKALWRPPKAAETRLVPSAKSQTVMFPTKRVGGQGSVRSQLCPEERVSPGNPTSCARGAQWTKRGDRRLWAQRLSDSLV